MVPGRHAPVFDIGRRDASHIWASSLTDIIAPSLFPPTHIQVYAGHTQSHKEKFGQFVYNDEGHTQGERKELSIAMLLTK
jgi:hypothetical protein